MGRPAGSGGRHPGWLGTPGQGEKGTSWSWSWGGVTGEPLPSGDTVPSPGRGAGPQEKHLWGRGSRLGCLPSETREQTGRRAGPRAGDPRDTGIFKRGIDEGGSSLLSWGPMFFDPRPPGSWGQLFIAWNPFFWHGTLLYKMRATQAAGCTTLQVHVLLLTGILLMFANTYNMRVIMTTYNLCFCHICLQWSRFPRASSTGSGLRGENLTRRLLGSVLNQQEESLCLHTLAIESGDGKGSAGSLASLGTLLIVPRLPSLCTLSRTQRVGLGSPGADHSQDPGPCPTHPPAAEGCFQRPGVFLL